MIWSHAYLFYGNDERAKDEAINFLLGRFLGERAEKSPDFFRIESAPITIEDVRSLKSMASQSPIAGAKNVFLVKEIENLSREAAPAMLKILEEPPAGSIIIATTKNTRAIPPTIKSRFSAFRFFSKSASREPGGGDEFELKLKKSLWGKEAAMRAGLSQDNILKLEKALRAYALSADPTANKRLIEEYLNILG
ncbi:hypothetical protein A2661_01360 [Candidatus Giovannonibacteria bacterium RIFCSPHIGHO2_01_FULL_45_24]|uniref:DNA polymerase III subunit delta n=1 Tax=Candidatus Giovannonibacteria bacterium RIFCSPLOWO2_01_FULL_46_32 TaxID=1798353 RepID=A0A1F5XHF1_9BACT|nr:MAG: hypothetical protein A2661_01360 [Candidatus Giovannonibacteria bacterium RIFCSPHIGHO2_01_FULL_45_24]OGF87343.1 MAG: hypothetical protein A3B19_03955 [Candidatus Giovannonibacteria bacterium RIFCSPLOWO2_01_FULL_46_32]